MHFPKKPSCGQSQFLSVTKHKGLGPPAAQAAQVTLDSRTGKLAPVFIYELDGSDKADTFIGSRASDLATGTPVTITYCAARHRRRGRERWGGRSRQQRLAQSGELDAGNGRGRRHRRDCAWTSRCRRRRFAQSGRSDGAGGHP